MARFRHPTESDIPELTRLFQSGDKEVRKEAALALGTRGSKECIEPIVAALSDDDDYVRSYAMMGMERGIEADQCATEFLEAVFPALVVLLDRDDQSISGRAPSLLLTIDSERAIPILLSGQYFTPENRELHYILQALNSHEFKTPHDNLLPLLSELKPRAEEYPYDYQYAEALIAYSNHPDEAAEEWLRTELKSANVRVREGAAEGLAEFHGITDPFQHVSRLMEQGGFEKLSDPQKHYYAVSTYGWEVSNGGHSQYFFNTSGNYWKSALAGVRAIGAEARAKVLEDAVAKFGPRGPPEDRAMRIGALEIMEKGQRKLFKDLDNRFYAASEDFDVLLPIYAIENKSHFAPSPEN